MTRTTDDLHPEPRWQPLGERVVRAPSSPPPAEPKQIAPGVIEGADGRLRTNLPLPKAWPCN